jgi:hypothetical protein
MWGVTGLRDSVDADVFVQGEFIGLRFSSIRESGALLSPDGDLESVRRCGSAAQALCVESALPRWQVVPGE